MIKSLFIGVVLILVCGSCSKALLVHDTSDCVCSEEQVWKLIFESDTFKRKREEGATIVIDDAYSYDSSRPAYWDFFTCRFFELVIDPDGVDSLQALYGKSSWRKGQKLASKRNVRHLIDLKELIVCNINVLFYDLGSPGKEGDSMHTIGKPLYPYGDRPSFCGDKGYLTLDDDSDGCYLIDFAVVADSCVITREDYYWYPYYTGYCGIPAYEIDWIDIIDFDMSLDSFYQIQYYDVMQKLDSIRLAKNPDVDSDELWRSHPEFMGKW